MRSLIIPAVILLITLAPVSAQEASRPLILVHGFYTWALGSGMCLTHANETKIGTWRNLQYAFMKEGAYSQGAVLTWESRACPAKGEKPPVYVFTYYRGCYEKKDAIETYTSRLGRAIDIAKRCSNASSVDVIAHSMGGLIARNYVATRNDTQSIARLILVATPNEGEDRMPLSLLMPWCLAKNSSWCPDEIRSIFRGSAFISALNSAATLPQSVYSISGSKDRFIPASGPFSIHSLANATLPCGHDALIMPHKCPSSFLKMNEFLGNEG